MSEEKRTMKIGGREFQTVGHTYVMGILNVTPDSFSDGGSWNELDRALYHVEEMVRAGADVIDIGGESTRPGIIKTISDQEEIRRVIPVIEAVKARFDLPVSLDTYKWSVAKAGIESGIDLVNDVWGLRHQDKMASVISESGLPCCLMHNRNNAVYQDFMKDLSDDLRETLALAEKAGIGKERIILDPGIGFAKSCEQNLEAMARLDELKILGCPLLLGSSRKSVIGLTLNLPVDQRLEGTLATTVIAVMKGCMFVRVHDVQENVRAIKMTEAIISVGDAGSQREGIAI